MSAAVSESDNIDLQKRSRRRLVGAAALALVAAIVLPMVMEGEPGFQSHDIEVRIPDQDADSTLARPIAGRTAVEPGAVPAPQEQAAVTDPVDDAEAESTSVPSPSEAPPPVAMVKPQDPPAKPQAPAAKPTPAPQTKDEAERVRAILEGKLAAAPAKPVSGGSFVVQIGAFGEPTKAASVSGDLNKRGFASYTERAGPVTRVRVGPFASRDEAERAAERLRALNMSAVVTAR